MTSIARPLAVLGCLAVSTVAFSAIHTYETLVSAAAEVLPDRAPTRIATAAVAPSTPGAAVSAEAVVETPPAAPVESVVDTAAPIDSTPPVPADAVHVPDFVGMRLSEAKRAARSLGIRIRARTSDGSSIASGEGRYYRVRTQRTSPGSDVAPDAVVDVRVRESVSYGGGY